MNRPIRILGIDPGLRRTGWGVVETIGNRLVHVACGSVTTDDKAFEGVIIYEATDGVILQTGADVTVRIAGKNVESMKSGTLSLMPTGLMDTLTATQIADLIAYLKALDGK